MAVSTTLPAIIIMVIVMIVATFIIFASILYTKCLSNLFWALPLLPFSFAFSHTLGFAHTQTQTWEVKNGPVLL